MGIRQPAVAGNGTEFRGEDDVAFRPNEFATAITTWGTVPWCATDFAPYGDKSVDHLAAVHTAANFAKGIGDICRYMGVVDGASWRMPTATEWAELYGSDQNDKGQAVRLPSSEGWIAGNYYPLSGYAFGPGRDGVKIIGSGAGARVGGADPYDDGAVFLPASGYRNLDNGAIYGIGSEGIYWAATAVSSSGGYLMWFNPSYVGSQGTNPRTFGFSVRCIRE